MENNANKSAQRLLFSLTLTALLGGCVAYAPGYQPYPDAQPYYGDTPGYYPGYYSTYPYINDGGIPYPRHVGPPPGSDHHPGPGPHPNPPGPHPAPAPHPGAGSGPSHITTPTSSGHDGSGDHGTDHK